MADFGGPANAPNATATRPNEDRVFPSLDSWFRDCSSDTAQDGTRLRSSVLNGWSAFWRNLIRVNGTRIDGTGPVIPEVGSDDFLAAKAVQHLIQRGQPTYTPDTGTINALNVTLSPVPPEYKEGMHLRVKVSVTNSGPATINVNGLGLKAITRPSGDPLLANDMLVGSIASLSYDGSKFQLQGARGAALLVNPLTIYVNAANGNDANDGSGPDSAHAMQTIQGAVNRAFMYAPSQYAITISIADGSYVRFSTPVYPGPTINMVGNVSLPDNVVINGGDNHACLIQGPNVMNVQGVKAQTNNTPTYTPCCYVATNGGTMYTAKTSSGDCYSAVFLANNGTMVPGDHVFRGNSANGFGAFNGGRVVLNSGTNYTVGQSITFGIATANASFNGSITVNATPNWVNGGLITGSRYFCNLNGVIFSNGLGPNFFPGTTAGSTASGGQYQ